ncbi:MAG: L,D-transpeptidase family protein [Candidatus Omnitrophica bacterium]|jgi:lipoprotein-anchoring transpeptidase ErfK/SrfK|nr:L,D-transpeptidase family protein [Candidatus Omnitrophota bacterium]
MKKLHLFIVAGILVLASILILLFLPKNKPVVQKKENKVSLPLKTATEALTNNNLLEAKRLYQQALSTAEDADEIDKIRAEIEKINVAVIFSPVIDECSQEYTVKPQDALAKIAKAFNTTVELIKLSNKLNSDVIRPGQKLKVNTCAFSIVVDKSQNLLFLKRKDEIVKTYLVATGKDNSTPVGNFKINNKLLNPTWFKAGAVIPPDSPDNILGSRWLGIDLAGYGIHGTTEPDNLGKQITLGCVRMKNEDVEELFNITPVGTEVTIVD